MQPGVTVVLATVWLVVYADVVGPTSLHPSRLTLDQYSPLAPQQRQHGLYRRIEAGLNWKDQNHDENQPFDLSIGSRRSISIGGMGTFGIRYNCDSVFLHIAPVVPLAEREMAVATLRRCRIVLVNMPVSDVTTNEMETRGNDALFG